MQEVKVDKNILKSYDNDFYKIMAENFGDEIFVTDGDGLVLFVNPKAVEVIGRPIYEIIGRNVKELVEEGFFKPSVTLEVLKHKKTVNMVQTLLSGRVVLVTGVPIFDQYQENIRMVISTTKDVEALNQLLQTIDQQQQELENLRNITFEQEGLVGSDAGIVKKTLAKIAPLDMTVLIQGETGVGKEVVAKAIHGLSHGKDKPMVKINCGTIPENLMESELFGYEQGAFTGAEKGGKKGKVEMAEGGTLFLDEIGEMPLSLQVKLLDFLQDGTFTRVGGTQKRKVNTRMITATNRDLKKMCDDGTFRMDLFYRINVIPFFVPPLRKRPEDIDILAKHFISRCNYKYKGKKQLNEEANKILHGHYWPGNVRELEHVIERAYVFSDDNIIGKEDFNGVLQGGDEPNSDQPSIKCQGLMPLKEAKWEIEKQLVTQAYEQLGSTYKVATVLKIDQSTVVKLLHKHTK